MLVCSNCHKELHHENHDMKKIKKFVDENKQVLNKEREINNCKDCGKIILNCNKSGYCQACLAKHNRKVERPSKEVLQELLKENSLNKIGKMYGVTHNAVKKWIINYGIWQKK